MPSKLPMIGVRLTHKQKAKAQAFADKERRSLSNWVLGLILKAIGRNGL